MRIGQYLYNIGYMIDQAANTLLLGHPDETISSRLGRAIRSGRPKKYVIPARDAVDWLAFVLVGEENHCDNWIEPNLNDPEKEIWSWIKEKP